MVCFRPPRPGFSEKTLLTHFVVALPLVLLLLGAGFLALGRWIRSRWQWVLAVSVSLGAWLAILVGWRSVPATLALSAWRPEDVFLDRVQLMLDPVGWPIQLAAVSVLLAGLLAEPARKGERRSGEWAGTLALAAAGLAAIQAGNLLTVAITWAILDVTGWAIPALSASSEPARERWVLNSAGVLLVLAAVIGLPEGGLGRGLSSLGSNPLAAGLVLAGAGLRLGSNWRGPASSDGAAAQGAQHVLRQVLPPAACLAALGRVLGIAEGPLVPWAAALGAVSCLAGSLAWVNASDDSASVAGLALGLAGIAGLSGAAFGGPVAFVWSACGVLFLVIGALSFVWRPFAKAYRLAPRWGALALVGLPFTSGALPAGALAGGGQSVVGWIAGFIGLAGLSVMALGLWRRAEMAAESWPTLERLPRASHVSGVLILLVTLTLTYVPLRSGAGSSIGMLGTGIALALLISAIFIRSRWHWAARPRGARAARWLDPAPILRVLGAPYHLLMQAVDRLADLLEGEAAVLWIYVIVLALSLAAGLGR